MKLGKYLLVVTLLLILSGCNSQSDRSQWHWLGYGAEIDVHTIKTDQPCRIYGYVLPCTRANIREHLPGYTKWQYGQVKIFCQIKRYYLNVPPFGEWNGSTDIIKIGSGQVWNKLCSSNSKSSQ